MQGSIDRAEVERFTSEELADGHNPKRVLDMVSIVSAVVKGAVRAGLCRDNPAATTASRSDARRSVAPRC